MSTEDRNSHNLIHKKDVITALQNDKGKNAFFKTYTVENLTAAGDNFASCVTKVNVAFSIDDCIKQVSYVVKLNPLRNETSDNETKVKFEKEIGFFEFLLPLLDEELLRCGEPPLRVPKYFHSVAKKDSEVIFLENLKPEGYIMHDRKKGLDTKHTELVLEELARMHSASSLVMSRGAFQGGDILEKKSFLQELYKIEKDIQSFDVKLVLGSVWDSALMIAHSTPGYEAVMKYLMSTKNVAYEMLMEQLKVTDQFKVICHGDCWNNNFLFRYSPDGEVEECRLLDFQGTRLGSPALDLNFMLYCSLAGDVRSKQLPSFLTRYYATFASVVAASGTPMKYTSSGLRKEFINKNTFGFIHGIMLMPLILMDADDIPKLENIVGADEAEIQKLVMQYMKEMIKKNKQLKPRLLSMFDEMMESGLIK